MSSFSRENIDIRGRSSGRKHEAPVGGKIFVKLERTTGEGDGVCRIAEVGICRDDRCAAEDIDRPGECICSGEGLRKTSEVEGKRAVT